MEPVRVPVLPSRSSKVPVNWDPVWARSNRTGTASMRLVAYTPDHVEDTVIGGIGPTIGTNSLPPSLQAGARSMERTPRSAIDMQRRLIGTPYPHRLRESLSPIMS